MPTNKNAVFIMLGQSNAVGYATLMPESERISTPLKNVFGLNRDNNLSFDNNSLVWTNYTSDGTILGEENDHTYSISNCLAQFWQNAIDEGKPLPNLYIITIAIGAQGVTEKSAYEIQYSRWQKQTVYRCCTEQETFPLHFNLLGSSVQQK